jgi:hypothetical protein
MYYCVWFSVLDQSVTILKNCVNRVGSLTIYLCGAVLSPSPRAPSALPPPHIRLYAHWGNIAERDQYILYICTSCRKYLSCWHAILNKNVLS